MRAGFLTLLLLLIGGWTVSAQDFGASYASEWIGPDKYKKHFQNWAIEQDERGVIYIANGDGILYNRGAGWKIIQTANATTALSLDYSADMGLAVGGVNEFGRLLIDSIGRFKHVAISDMLPDSIESFSNIWSTHIFNDTIIFVGKERIYRYANDSLEFFHAQNQEYYHAFNVDGKLWIGDQVSGLYVFVDDHVERLPFGEVFSGHRIAAAFPFNGKYLVVDQDKGMFLYDPYGKVPVKQLEIPEVGEMGNRFERANRLSDSLFSISTNKGVYLFDGSYRMVENFANGGLLKPTRYNNVMLDQEENLWVTSNNGFNKISYHLPIKKMEAEKHFGGITNNVAISDDKMFVASVNGLYMVTDSVSYKKTENLVKKMPDLEQQIFEVKWSQGDVLAAGVGGCYALDTAKLEMTRIVNDYTRSIAFNREDATMAVVGGKRSLAVVKKVNGKWKQHYYSKELDDETLTMVQDPNDPQVYWAGMFSIGCAKIKFNETFTDHTVEYFGENDGLGKGYVNVFVIDDTLRFCPKFIKLNKRVDNQFVEDVRFSAGFDETASSWLVAAGKHGETYVEISGPILLHQNGVIDSSTFADLGQGYLNGITFDNHGAAWLTSEGGIAKFDPRGHRPIENRFDVLISAVKLNDDSLLFGGNFVSSGTLTAHQPASDLPVLLYKDNDVSFLFSSPTFYNQSLTKYSYRLEGFSDHFSKWSQDKRAVFTNLEEGSYSFHVRALNALGNLSGTTVYRFEILPPWYRTWWAYLLGVLVLGGTIWLVVVLNAMRLKAQNIRLQEIIEENVAELRGQRDQIQLQKDLVDEKNKDIMDSIVYAERIQKAILPSESDLHEVLPSSFVLFKPRDIVSGDFYWADKIVNEHKKHLILFSVADCTGHGVPGAFVSIVGSNLLKIGQNLPEISSPAKILDYLNEGIVDTFNSDKTQEQVRDGMDVAFCAYHPDSKILEYAGAKNNLYLIRKSDVLVVNDEAVAPKLSIDGMHLFDIRADKHPIGAYTETLDKFRNNIIKLEKGDTIYIFSDGYVDQFGGGNGKKFKTKPFKKMLLSIQHMSMDEQHDHLDEAFVKWRGDIDQIDDVCILGVRV